MKAGPSGAMYQIQHPHNSRRVIGGRTGSSPAVLDDGRRTKALSHVGAGFWGRFVSVGLVALSSASSFALLGQRLAIADLFAAAALISMCVWALRFTGLQVWGWVLPVFAYATLAIVHAPTSFEGMVVGLGPFLGISTFFWLSTRMTFGRLEYIGIACFGLANIVVAVSEVSTTPRASGLFRFPNELGFYGASMLFLALFLPRNVWPSTSSRLLLAGVGLASTVLSGGRTSALTVVLLLLCAVLKGGRKQNLPVGGLALGALVASGVVIAATQPAAIGAVQRLQDRTYNGIGLVNEQGGTFFYFDNWIRGLQAAYGFPHLLIGRGPEEATVASSTLSGEFIVHNTLIGILLGTGIAGLVALLIALRNAWRVIQPGLIVSRGSYLPLMVFLAPKVLLGSALNTRSLWVVVGVYLASRRTD